MIVMVTRKLTICIVICTLLGMLVIVGVSFSRADDNNESLIGLEGTWDLSVIGTPFRIIRTFFKGGVNIDTSSFTPITPTQGPLLVSDGHGNWTQIGAREFAVVLQFFQLDPRQVVRLDSLGTVRERVILSEDLRTYVGIFQTDVALPNGDIIPAGGIVLGQRVPVP